MAYVIHKTTKYTSPGYFCHFLEHRNININRKHDKTQPKTLLRKMSSTTTMEIPLKERLRNGETLYGLFLCSFSPTIAEISGHSGYDFVVIDMEHGYGGISAALPCLHALAATRTPAILRLPESSATWVKKALDLGPQGLMFPMIDSPESAQKAVLYCRYPPKGVRGAAHPIVRASNYGLDHDYLAKCEDNLLVMCQVESMDAVEKAREISDVDGVDCIMIGPLDLSASAGFLHDPGNERVRAIQQKVENTVKEIKNRQGGPYLAGFAMQHDSAVEMRRRGYQMVLGGVDIGLYRDAAVKDVRRFKNTMQ